MKKIYLAAIAGNLGMLSVGQFFGWSSPSLPVLMQGKDEKYPMRLTPEEASWVASLLTFGAPAGNIICAVIVNIFGRKNTMLFTAVPSIISWLMIAFATSLKELYVSRFISGLATGIAYTATPMVATYFNMKYNHMNTNDITWLPATGVIIYTIMFSLGLASLPFTLLSEIFPINVKALGSMIVLIVISLMSSVVTRSYLIIADIAGIHVPFWIFTACNIAGAIFIFFYVPETKDKTLEQIQEKLQGLSRQ